MEGQDTHDTQTIILSLNMVSSPERGDKKMSLAFCGRNLSKFKGRVKAV